MELDQPTAMALPVLTLLKLTKCEECWGSDSRQGRTAAGFRPPNWCFSSGLESSQKAEDFTRKHLLKSVLLCPKCFSHKKFILSHISRFSMLLSVKYLMDCMRLWLLQYYFQILLHFVLSHLRSCETSDFSLRSPAITWFGTERERMFLPKAGNHMLPSSFLLFAACAVPSRVKVTQGHF